MARFLGEHIFAARAKNNEWLGLVDDLRRVTIFELPGFVCELRRGILSAAIGKPISA